MKRYRRNKKQVIFHKTKDLLTNSILKDRELKIEKSGNGSLSNEHMEEIQVIFHKTNDMLTNSTPNNDNNKNNN